MNIIFVSNVCDKEEYEYIFNHRNKKIIDPMQKFLNQIISGVAKNVDKVFSISVRPVSYSTINQRKFEKKIKKTQNIDYIYPPFSNGLFSRFLTQFTAVYKEVCNIIEENELDSNKTVIICDALCLQASMAARLAGKHKKVPSVAIVTDIPIMATKMKSSHLSVRQFCQSLYEKLTMFEIKKYNGYINLVKGMDRWINPLNKPSTVIEGTVETVSQLFIDKEAKDKKIVLYAGGINKKYGLETLVKAFVQCKRNDAELHIYGDGVYVAELQEFCKIHSNVKYMGVALNAQMVELESQATLLVNPRFSNEEYTFYSFPSKTLEYMSSGTPVCSTRLRGIPDEYEDYLYWFDEESVEGFSNTLNCILDKDFEELANFGKNAKNFVDKYKNNYIQGTKIAEFCQQILECK